MTTLEMTRRRPVRRNPRFFIVMSFLLAAIVIFGFSHTVPFDFDPPGLPVLILLHGLLFAAWVLLFIVQPILVARRSLTLHRKLGWLGVGLTGAMLAMGAYAILFALWNDALPPFYRPSLFLTRGIIGLAVFAGLVAASVVKRSSPEWHKRLMLCASLVIIVPALERSLPIPLFGDSWPFVVDGAVDAVALFGPAVDLWVRGRIHPAYYWGVGAIVLGQVMVDLIAPSPLASVLLRLVGVQ